jgi:uncharacterized membrane protein YfcA
MAPAWCIPVGLAGGIFSALFGAGGPVYVIFLAGRIADKAALRATAATVVAISALLRLATFAVNGLLWQHGLLLLCACLLPMLILGLWVGNHIHHRLDLRHVIQVISSLLLLNGATLLARGFGLL